MLAGLLAGCLSVCLHFTADSRLGIPAASPFRSRSVESMPPNLMTTPSAPLHFLENIVVNCHQTTPSYPLAHNGHRDDLRSRFKTNLKHHSSWSTRLHILVRQKMAIDTISRLANTNIFHFYHISILLS